MLDIEHAGRIPPDGDIVIVHGDDHSHVIYGSAEDLKAAGYTKGGRSTKGLAAAADALMPEPRLALENERKRTSKEGARDRVPAVAETPKERAARKPARKPARKKKAPARKRPVARKKNTARRKSTKRA